MNNPAAIELMKPELERLAAEYESPEREEIQRTKPALDMARIKDLVVKGLVFYQERVLGPLGAMAQEKTTMVVRKAKSKKLLKGGDGPATKHPEGRPCTAELEELLRLLDVKLTYDPDRKEGTLDFSPFR